MNTNHLWRDKDNRERILVHVHGGAYLLSLSEAATKEAIELPGFRWLQSDLC
jgi:hypothetical protein